MPRWYSQCCRTPLFHSVDNGWFPFVTAHVATLDTDCRAAAIGEPRGHTFANDGSAAPGTFPEVSRLSILARFVVRMWKDLLSGDFRRAELFDPDTLKPIVRPRRLSPAERAHLYSQTAGLPKS